MQEYLSHQSTNSRDIYFQGYVRPDGKVGTRNLVAVLYTVDCARIVSQRIAQSIPNGVSVGWYSCYSTEDSNDTNTLVGLGSNPNFSSAIVVGLGCQHISPYDVAKAIKKGGKPAASLEIQGTGGTKKTIESGTKIADKFFHDGESLDRTDSPISSLSTGLTIEVSRTSFEKVLSLMSSFGKDFAQQGGRILTDHLVTRSRAFEANKGGSVQTVEPGVYPAGSGIYEVDGMAARSALIYKMDNNSYLTDFAAAGAQIMIRATDEGFGIGNVVSPTINLWTGGSPSKSGH